MKKLSDTFAKNGAAFLVCLFVLAACAGSDDDDTLDAKTMPICPQVVIVRELDIFNDYGREKPDPDQLVAEAKMLAIDGECEYLKEGGVDINFTLSLIAARGPRLGGLHAGFPFFVAVVDADGNVLNKENMTADFGFASDGRTADDAEDLHVFIPLAKDKRSTGPHYRVLVGFQVEREKSGPDVGGEDK